MKKQSTVNAIVVVLLLVTLVVPGMALAAPPKPSVHFWLTILHNNDGESQVVNAGSGLEDFGGAARFKAVVDAEKWDATHGPWTQRGAKRGVVMISSGDNFIASPEFNASLDKGVPFYDTIAMELIGYNAVNLGNHDFDFGPDVLADFIAGYTNPPPYLAANLDFGGEPRLQAYVDAGVIVPATILHERGERIGVIGIDTPSLPFISSPRNVTVSDDLVNIVQGQIDKLQAMGVDKIILAAHLQTITGELALAEDLRGIDVIIAGGGDELLANPGDLLLPGDEGLIWGAYPQIAFNADGQMVPVVTTSGEYRYVGKLVVGFDKAGRVVAIDEERSGPVRVATGDCNGYLPCDDAVEPDPVMQAMVVDPVEAHLSALGQAVIGVSEVDLDGLRGSVRTMETSEGNLIADALRWQAGELAASFGVPLPDVALQNGGGIRNNTIIEAGDITLLDTFDMLPFANFLSLVPGVPRAQCKDVLENAGSRVELVDGRFAQISGFSYTRDPADTPQLLNDDGTVATPGTRVVDVVLDDGTVIVSGGAVVDGPPLNVATIDFLAQGGDQYPFRGAPYTTLGVTYQLALANYIEVGLSGLISAADYPWEGEDRIVQLP